MDQTVRFQEILRRLAIIDESLVEDQAGLGLDMPGSGLLDPKTAALVRVGALVAIGSPGVCLEWGTTRALAAGATEDEITGVLLAIAPVAGLGRVTGAVPGVAAALGYAAAVRGNRSSTTLAWCPPVCPLSGSTSPRHWPVGSDAGSMRAAPSSPTWGRASHYSASEVGSLVGSRKTLRPGRCWVLSVRW